MEIKRAYSSDFDIIYPLLMDFQNSNVSKEEWIKLFTNRYVNDEDFFGVFISEENKAYGYLGLIFANRLINGKEYKFANMTAWIVKPEHRNNSLRLIFEALSIPGTIFTNITPNPDLWDLLLQLGFTTVDNFFYITPSLFVCNIFSGLKFITDISSIKARVSQNEVKLIDDHKNSNCKPYLFIKSGKQCLVFANRIYKKRLPFSQVLYVSDKTFISNNLHGIAGKICFRQRTPALYTGEHFTSGKPFLSYKYNRKTFFKGDGLLSSDIDFLYSELA